MDSTRDELMSLDVPAGARDDLSAIAWVHDELRKSLDAAHKALRRFVKDSETGTGSDIDSVDPGVLRNARAQIHQGVGALELVGLPAAAIVLRASEAAVQRGIAKPHALTAALVGDIERLSFALLDFLTRLLAGKPVSPLSLFPQYRAVQEGVEAERVHPADLWSVDWRWREVLSDPQAVPRQADAAAQSAIEGLLLALMRGQQPLVASARMSDLCAGLGAGAADAQVRTFWNLAAGVFDAQQHGLLGFDVFSKRVASRLLAQFRILQRGDTDVSERLARDLLFFCSQSTAPSPGHEAPRLAAVREVYSLDQQTPTDYATSALGRFDPATIAHAKKRVAAAKEAWSAAAGGELHRLAGLSEQFALVGDSLRKLFPLGDSFAGELQNAVTQTQHAGVAPPAPLAMEVATSLLYIEAALDDADFDNPEHAQRVRRLAERLEGVRQNQPAQPLEKWMEELYRRVSDRQTMGSVVQELRASLSGVEKAIDLFFRNPADHAVLMEVPSQLSSMRGVLSVLGMDQAAAALLHMRDEVDALVQAGIDPARLAQGNVFDRLAGNLSALGFVIDMLSVQPQMAKSLFVFDAAAGTLAPVMGRSTPEDAEEREPSLAAPVEQRLIEQAQMLAFSSVREDVPLQDVTRDLERLSHEAQAADQPALAAAVLKAQEALGKADGADDLSSARGDLSEALVDFVATATEPAGLGAISIPATLSPIKSMLAVSDLEHDDEMREVFLEEAREVVHGAHTACTELIAAPADLALLTTLRRAFHTLKGSSRMVGLAAFGDAAWVCEQVYNTQLADQRAAESPLLEFTQWSLGYLGGWVEEIAGDAATTHDVEHVKSAASRLARRAGADAGDAASDIALPLTLPPDLPSAADLDLRTVGAPAVEVDADEDVASEDVATGGVSSGDATTEAVAFELDLSGLDGLPTLADAPAPTAGQIDGNASAMFDPFESMRGNDAMQTTLANEQFDPAAGAPSIDLDLGEPASRSMIQSLTPSLASASTAGQTAPGSEHGLLLDLSTGEALPAANRRDGGGRELDSGAGVSAGPTSDFEEHGVDILTESGALDEAPDNEHVKVVGKLRIGIPLFNIYLNEADELSRRLTTELAEWAMELHRPVGESAIALAHSLAGSSATVGFADLSQLARTLEHALTRSEDIGHGNDEEARLFVHAAEEIRRLLHQFAAGFLREPSVDLLKRLSNHELSSALRLEAITAASELVEGSAAADGADDEAVAGESLSMLAIDHGPESAPDEVVGAEASAAPVVGADDSTHLPDVSDGFDGVLDAPGFEAAEATALAVEPEPGPEHELESRPESAFEPEPDSLPVAQPDFDDARGSAFATLTAPFDALGIPALKPLGAAPLGAQRVGGLVHSQVVDIDDDIDAVDAVDLELFPIFEEEALELLPQLGGQLREWAHHPEVAAHPAACMRTLHTLKGGARLAGAMRLGEMAHRLESRIERLVAKMPVEAEEVEVLEGRSDAMLQAFESLRGRDAQAYADAETAAAQSAPQQPTAALDPTSGALDGRTSSWAVPASRPASEVEAAAWASAEAAGAGEPSAGLEPAFDAAAAPAAKSPEATSPAEVAADSGHPADSGTAPDSGALRSTGTAPHEAVADLVDPPAIDWSRFARDPASAVKPVERVQAASQAAVRVRAPLLDRLVNQAGEVSITRSRIESGVGQIKSSLGDLTENLERLRGQLRDIELQGEVQMSSRLEAAKAASQSFDPLEFDRFTRFQELTRMMAESVNDVATVQRTLQRSLESTEDELVAQARLTRELQDDLLRTRMIEFEGLSDRLYRVVRMTAKETGKQVRLDIVGGSIEVDRGVLDRMTGSFEHLLRNCITHGIESPEARVAAGKEAAGTIVVALSHEGNEVGVEFRDDGAGLDLPRIRSKATAMGLLDAGAEVDDAALANFIFTAGFSTADSVTELAGRGVGMDVVRSDVIAMGGRIETATDAGKGTSFKLILPLTTAVTQVVMLRCGDSTVAVPSTLVELVRRATPAEVDAAYTSGSYTSGERSLPFFWLGALLQLSPRPAESSARSRTVVLIRSAQQRIAIHVDEVLGNQEVVVKNLGPQLSRLPGLAGITLLASGAAALIYNPVALATLYGDAARAATRVAFGAVPAHRSALLRADELPQAAPLVLVVDDSLTVRRVTQRMLVREGYRVVLAKDGLDALERLAEEVPKIVLSDIEMPRMDGFDLVRNIRADARLRALPIIMITSRIAQKHREHATELGVDHYLGKPYSEEDLLALVGRYAVGGGQAQTQS